MIRPPAARNTALAALAAALLLALAAPGAARAQDAGVGGSLAATDFFIGVQTDNGVNLTDFQVERFFNKANCDCDAPVFIFITLLQSGLAKRLTTPSGNVDFWIGSSCADATQRALGKCFLVKSEQIVTFLNLGHETLQTNARVISTNTALTTTTDGDGGVVSTPTVGTFTPNANCTATTNKFASTIFALFDYGADGVYDLTVSRAVNVRLQPPPAPTEIDVRPGNEALVVNWTQVDSVLYPDLQGYQVLCRRGADLQVFKTGSFDPSFQICPATATGTGIEDLNPLFVCSPLLSRLTTSYRVQILQNGVTYAAGVASVDISGNASPIDLFFAVPEKTNSFYDVYRKPFDGTTGPTAMPGQATGGFCAVGGESSRGSAAVAATSAALVAIGAVLARRRRRR